MNISLIKTFEVSGIRERLEKFIKITFRSKTENNKSTNMAIEDRAELISMIRNTKDAWHASMANYDYATESDMIDYYTYQIKANQLRFEYLIKRAKKEGLKVNHFEGI